MTELDDDAALAECLTLVDRTSEWVEPAEDDLVVGPLRYSGLANGYTTHDGLPLPLRDDGLAFYKRGVEIEQGAEVTVAIGDSARDYASILVEQGRPEGYREVTFKSCTHSSSDLVNWWVGGFLLHGRDSACVPLVITEPGAFPVMVDVAFPVGACD